MDVNNKHTWQGLTTEPPDAIFHLAARAKAAPEPKADLAIGAYRDAEGRPYPLKVVRKAEHKLLDMNLDYEYLPMSGHAPFVAEALKLLYRDEDLHRVVGVQTLSGTGAVWLGAELLARVCDRATTPVYLSDPTWANHHSIFALVGWKDIRTYRYYNAKTVDLDFDGMKTDLQAAPPHSVVVLHQCAHNPTGIDPTKEQWNELADVLLARQHYVFFDSAYQGYASGSLENDAYAARLFMSKGIEFVCAQSFSKNMGLYNERVGTLSAALHNASYIEPVLSNMKAISRACYSNPPAHGARIAHLVMSDKELRAEWEAELTTMSGRIREMRETVYNELLRLGTPGTWDHIIKQIGMFSFLGLTKEQCKYCQDRNVFITMTGRASMAGLTKDKCSLLARTVDQAVRSIVRHH